MLTTLSRSGRHNWLTLFMLLVFISRAEPRVTPYLARQEVGENSGVFIGVNEFSNASYRPLRFAANDAVAMADAFVNQLGLLDAANATILISGAVTGPFVARLEALKSAGCQVTETGANRFTFFATLRDAVQRTGKRGFLVVGISSHGQEKPDGFYVPLADSLDGVSATMLRLSDVDELLNRIPEAKRLVLVDACRSTIETEPGEVRGDSGKAPSPAAALRQAFQKARGKMVVTSCQPGQVSLEDSQRKLGAFMGSLVDAFAGAGDTGQEEFITLGVAIATANALAQEKAKVIMAFSESANRFKVQQVDVSGPEDIRQLRVGKSVAYAERKSVVEAARQALMMAHKTNPEQLPAETFVAVSKALDGWTGASLETLVARIRNYLGTGDRTMTKDFATKFEALQSEFNASHRHEPSKENESKEETDQPPEPPAIRTDLDLENRILIGPFSSDDGSLDTAKGIRLQVRLAEALQGKLRNVKVVRLESKFKWPKNESEARSVLETHNARLMIRPLLLASEQSSRRWENEETLVCDSEVLFQLTGFTDRKGHAIASEEASAKGRATQLSGLRTGDISVEATNDAIGRFVDDGIRLGQYLSY